METERTCKTCGLNKPLSAFPRAKGRNGKIFFRRSCKSCRREYENQWKANNVEHLRTYRKRVYAENQEEIKIRVKEWQKNNRNRKLQYQREWYQLSREERLARQRKRYQENKEAVAAYREANKEQIARRMRKWRKANSDVLQRYQEEWRQENANRLREYEREYRAQNPQVKRLSEARRRAAKRSSEGSFTWDDVETLIVLQNSQCVYCNRKLGTKFHIDHITPLSRGGENTAENIQLLCRSCNLKKHAKTHEEFLSFLAKRV